MLAIRFQTNKLLIPMALTAVHQMYKIQLLNLHMIELFPILFDQSSSVLTLIVGSFHNVLVSPEIQIAELQIFLLLSAQN